MFFIIEFSTDFSFRAEWHKHIKGFSFGWLCVYMIPTTFMRFLNKAERKAQAEWEQHYEDMVAQMEAELAMSSDVLH